MGWVPAPRQYPNRCFLTGLSSREHGPYYEVDAARPYIDPATRREGRMYWCFASWRTTVVDPNSPYAIILEEEVERRTTVLKERIEQLEALLAADPIQAAAAQMKVYITDSIERDLKVSVPKPPDDTPDPQARPKRRNAA